MENYTRVMLGFMGLCTLGYVLRLDAPFVLGTILSGGITIIGIYDAVTGEDDEI